MKHHDVSKSNQTLPFVSSRLCFLGFVHRHNELFLIYLWSFDHKFTSYESDSELMRKERPHILILRLRCMRSK